MKFNDEYELELGDKTYYVYIAGKKMVVEGKYINDLEEILIHDELGDMVDTDHPDYDDIYEDAVGRDFDLEVHSRDFDYYGDHG